MLLAITALLKARLWQLIADPKLDPLVASTLPATTLAEDILWYLMKICKGNQF
ncbi:MAG: hypothetical protein ACHBN1_18670 [Heteroscytonema crispum UTEX LB 1556]